MLEDYTLYIIIFAVLLLIVLYFSFAYIMYGKLLVDYNKPPKNLVDHEEPFFQPSFEWYQEIPKEEISIRSYDGLTLRGVFIPSFDKNSDSIAIVMHGYQSKGTDMIIIAKMYSDLGFKVILPDLRGHGSSEGDFTSMGYYEKYDLKRWINYALASYGATEKILIHGTSMGAAMAMMVTAMDIPQNLKFMVLDSGFTNMGASLKYSVKPKSLAVFLPGVNVFTYLKHRYFLSRISPIKAMKTNQIPFLIIHGEADQLVPVSMAHKLYEASPAAHKNILIIENARHALGYKVDKDLCQETIINDIKDIFTIKKSYIKKM